MFRVCLSYCLVLWSPALGSLACDVSCVFVIFPSGVLGQVWYLIVSIPDLCLLSYFYSDDTKIVTLTHRQTELMKTPSCTKVGLEH